MAREWRGQGQGQRQAQPLTPCLTESPSPLPRNVLSPARRSRECSKFAAGEVQQQQQQQQHEEQQQQQPRAAGGDGAAVHEHHPRAVAPASRADPVDVLGATLKSW